MLCRDIGSGHLSLRVEFESAVRVPQFSGYPRHRRRHRFVDRAGRTVLAQAAPGYTHRGHETRRHGCVFSRAVVFDQHHRVVTARATADTSDGAAVADSSRDRAGAVSHHAVWKIRAWAVPVRCLGWICFGAITSGRPTYATVELTGSSAWWARRRGERKTVANNPIAP